MGKTSDLLKKIRDTRGTFHAKMGTIKDRNGKDLKKQKRLKRGDKNTQKNCIKKILMTQITTMMQSLTQLHILECEIKWALGSITTSKASGGDGIPAELFQILRDDAVKVLHSISQQIWKIQQQPQDWKRSVFIPIPKKDNDKEYLDYLTTALISYASKIMLKILQARFQQYVNQELTAVQGRFIKGRGTRDQIANILWIIEKARKF